jgi:hypothetical protein
MALADIPKSFILRMFQMEAREGRGEHCQVFPDGAAPEALPLNPGELVYGIYKAKYFFTETALIVSRPAGRDRIEWSKVAECSSRHGDGSALAKLAMVDGKVKEIDLREIVKGHSGRISQLIHGMIERWGAPGSTGTRLLSVEQFLAAASDEYAFAPNLEPHPTLGEIGLSLLDLRSSPGVARVLLADAGAPERELAIDRVVIVASAPADQFAPFVAQLRASGIVEAGQNTRKLVGAIEPHLEVWEVLWD